MAVSIDDIKKLKELTGVGLTDAKNALVEAEGDFDKALEAMRKKGLTKAEKKADREALEGVIDSYVHGGRIGVISILTGGDEELAKDVAMHVAAASPQFVKPENVPAEVVEKEKEIQIEIAIQSGKPADIAEKMVAGRMKKFTGEVSLTGQPFVKDPSISVAELLKNNSADVINFVRFEVGEGIEKKTEDFAAEVAAQMAAAKK